MDLPESFAPALTTVLFILVIAYFSLLSYTSGIQESKDSKPYSNIGHPKKNFLDKVFGFLLACLVPLYKLCLPLSHKKDDYLSSEENQCGAILMTIRRAALKYETIISHLPFCFLWNRLITRADRTDYLVKGIVLIPRKSNILIEWGIKKSAGVTQSDLDFAEDMPVEVEITCPRNVIEGDLTFVGKGFGFRKFQTCKLEALKLSPHAPIMLHVHGGGFVVGGLQDLCAYLMYSLASQHAKKNKNDIAAPMILASVKYRLAPENPFPAGVIDCLSAADFFIGSFAASDIHISGFSAGGNLATVVGFECARKYPGKVKSIVALNPCLLPRCKTISVHMNSKSNLLCPSESLIWFWSAYLQLGDFNDHESYIEELGKHELYQLGNVGSINPCLRLIYPQIDIPKALKLDTAPKIFVATGSADVLRDDGNDLVECLKDEKVNVTKYEFFGSHGLCVLLDFGEFGKFAKEWSEVVWP